MEVQPTYLLQLEDGPLFIAVHSDVPQYERFCEMIHANQGVVVEDASSADFCIVSLVTPGAGEIAEELRSEGKLAIQDYWIRDSIDAGHLLPWYPYQIGINSPLSTSSGRASSSSSAGETEERDIHELVIISARYWPLLPVGDLHLCASRKCPHRSATSFKQLYETHQTEIESRVAYLRGRLDDVLGFNSDFSRRPRMSFGSPNKHVPLSIIPPSSSLAFAASSAAALMPTPTDTSDSRGQAEMPDPKGTAMAHHEIPYEPPNIDNSPAPFVSPAPVDALSGQETAVVGSKSKGRTGSIAPTVPPSGTAGSLAPVAVGSEDAIVLPSASEISVTLQDKQELAKFLVEYPKGNVSFVTHVETFRKIYPRGQLRSAASWKYIYRKYGEEVRRMMNRLLKKADGETLTVHGSGSKARLSPVPPAAISPPSRAADRPSRTSRRHSPHTPKPAPPSPKKITEEDRQALALWMLDHPRDPKTKTRTYFEMFARHYDVNNNRTVAGWESGASRHREDIAQRQRKIILERKGKFHAAKQQETPNPNPSTGQALVRIGKKQGGNLEDADSELSSIGSDSGR